MVTGDQPRFAGESLLGDNPDEWRGAWGAELAGLDGNVQLVLSTHMKLGAERSSVNEGRPCGRFRNQYD
jgi:hypothetical protein